MTGSILAWNAALVLALMTALWAVSVIRRDVSLVDPWWSISFLVILVDTIARTEFTPAKAVVLALVALWALRLWWHLLRRGWGQPEDPRYAEFRRRFGRKRYWWLSFFQVFLLQGALALVVSAPLVVAGSAAPPDRPSLAVWLGGALASFGIAFEAVADDQLRRFRARAENRGQVLQTGLWSLSRHPNYFGEAAAWWGFWVCSITQPLGWAAVVSPILMTFLLLRVSGVTLLERHLSGTRPGYAAYVKRTPAFLPRWRCGRPAS